MKCPKCGKEINFVICKYCNTNVVWYQKYGKKEKESKKSK